MTIKEDISVLLSVEYAGELVGRRKELPAGFSVTIR
jgi:hypothetical protein